MVYLLLKRGSNYEKILFIESHNGKISGAQKVTLNVAKLLSERGDDLTVMYPGAI